ncbi:type II toxin-antitoxin system death-on-curing family toxin [Candidatus Gottesmanbacteria bacterium]|nr:type II toxin-antitoxin system death-on-curing family toxin [Candidatus Gottesmanbacteria bacterium]
MAQVTYLQLEEVLAIRDGIMGQTTGRKGILDFTLLHSALERPKATFAGQDLYKNLFDKASALIHSFIQNHPFNDGNKRTALGAMVRFLYVNGYVLKAEKHEIVDFTLKIQNHKYKFKDIALWVKKHVKKMK